MGINGIDKIDKNIINVFFLNTVECGRIVSGQDIMYLTEQERQYIQSCPKRDKVNENFAMLTLKHYVFEKLYGIANYHSKIERGAYGKPRFVGGQYKFNVSGNKKSVAIAVSNHEEVGIDVDLQRPFPGRVIKGFFTEKDQEKILLGKEEFMRAWTRKEAYLKCIGTGWSVHSDESVLTDVIMHEGKKYYIEDFDVDKDAFLSLCQETVDEKKPNKLYRLKFEDIYNVLKRDR